jgi:ADP-ribose pyrophosphatase YjhB (NUDIX family)
MSAGAQSASPLGWARRLQAIAQNGLAFSRDPFDRERYGQLQQLATEMLSQQLQVPLDQARKWWRDEVGYATPKVDVRGGVFDGDRVLLVRERADGRWTLPGGWVDVNDAPSEAVEREIHEESGYQARAVKLAALVDRNRHPHPPAVYHIYKLFFVCELRGGSARVGAETDAVDFFPVGALPELSTGRVLAPQIERLYRHRLEPGLPADFD